MGAAKKAANWAGDHAVDIAGTALGGPAYWQFKAADYGARKLAEKLIPDAPTLGAPPAPPQASTLGDEAVQRARLEEQARLRGQSGLKSTYLVGIGGQPLNAKRNTLLGG